MKKTITNFDITAETWEYCFTRDELRKIASTNGICRGRDKEETASNIHWGAPYGVEFPVTIEVK